MKICILTHDLNPKAGWGRYASELIAGIKRAGHDVLVIKEVENEHDSSPAVIQRRLGILRSALIVKRLAKDCDIIHALDLYPFGIIASLASLKAPLIITALGTYSIAPFYRFPTKFFARSAARASSAIVAISTYTKEEFVKNATPKDIKVVTPGVRLDKFLQTHERTDSPYILSVGALKYRKGYHISIPAFARVRKNIPNLRYVIVADQDDPAYLEELRRIVSENNLMGAVEFKSHIKEAELINLYRKADLFVLTSVNEGFHVEGFGLVFLEAAASGVPVVGTLGNGIMDAVSDNGVLVPQGDIQATAEAITRILTNLETWERMSRASTAWALSHSLDVEIKQYLDLYESLKLHG